MKQHWVRHKLLSVNPHIFLTMSYCFTPSHLMLLSTFTPQEWRCVINLRAVQLHISNPPAWSVWRYWFGFLPTRVMICVCLVWPSDRRDFFKLPFCTRSLVPSTPDIPSVISHPFQRVCCAVTGDPREWQGHLRHGTKTRVMVLNRQWLSPNPSARWPLSGREMDNSPGFTHANRTGTHKTHIKENATILNMFVQDGVQ